MIARRLIGSSTNSLTSSDHGIEEGANSSNENDNGLSGYEGSSDGTGSPLKSYCTGCKSKQSSAVAHCVDCTNLLCSNCVMAHQFMHCFEGHRVVDIIDSEVLL